MTAAQIAEIAHARPYRDGYRGPCPVHRGKSGTSFCIRQGDDGRVLIRCWSGCSTVDILGALCLRWADLFAGPRQPRPTDVLDVRTRNVVAMVQGSLCHHPARRSFGDAELRVIITSSEHAGEAMAHALTAAAQGDLVQAVLESELGKCSQSGA